MGCQVRTYPFERGRACSRVSSHCRWGSATRVAWRWSRLGLLWDVRTEDGLLFVGGHVGFLLYPMDMVLIDVTLRGHARYQSLDWLC